MGTPLWVGFQGNQKQTVTPFLGLPSLPQKKTYIYIYIYVCIFRQPLDGGLDSRFGFGVDLLGPISKPPFASEYVLSPLFGGKGNLSLLDIWVRPKIQPPGIGPV